MLCQPAEANPLSQQIRWINWIGEIHPEVASLSAFTSRTVRTAEGYPHIEWMLRCPIVQADPLRTKVYELHLPTNQATQSSALRRRAYSHQGIEFYRPSQSCGRHEQLGYIYLCSPICSAGSLGSRNSCSIAKHLHLRGEPDVLPRSQYNESRKQPCLHTHTSALV